MMPMGTVYQNVGQIVAMLVLLAGSAFFSSSETAFFNLTRRQIKQINHSIHPVQKLLARLLKRPGQLLNCLLLGNITVNVLYFAVSSTLMLRLKTSWGVSAAAALAFATFMMLVLLGEILPKSLAYSNSWKIASLAALPAFLCVQVFGPLAFLARVLIVEPIMRILLGHRRLPKTVTLTEFRSLIDFSRQRGLISEDENRLLAEVVELGFLKVRDVMQPRVDMVACEVADSPSTVKERMRRHGLTKMPVYVRDIDRVVGMVHLRQLLLRPEASLDRLVQPVQFVPEQKTVESLLEFFRNSQTDVAVVVDEYGGIAGSVRLEDIAEELFGEPETNDGIEPIQQLGPFEYRLSGSLSIHDWADVFGLDPGEMRLATIGGVVTALLGRIPREGDVAQLKNLRFTVERVGRHRIESVILSLEPIEESG